MPHYELDGLLRLQVPPGTQIDAESTAEIAVLSIPVTGFANLYISHEQLREDEWKSPVDSIRNRIAKMLLRDVPRHFGLPEKAPVDVIEVQGQTRRWYSQLEVAPDAKWQVLVAVVQSERAFIAVSAYSSLAHDEMMRRCLVSLELL